LAAKAKNLHTDFLERNKKEEDLFYKLKKRTEGQGGMHGP
jgi:hypothetical protein